MNLRRTWLSIACCMAILLVGSVNGIAAKRWAYVASRTKGLCLFEFDGKTGALKNLGPATDTSGAGFITIHPSKNLLYALNTATIDGKKTGVVSSFSINRSTGKLTFLNQQPACGAGPTHLIVDNSGKNVLLANYGSGSVAVFPIERDGKLGAMSSFQQHKGSSVNPQRQEGPHAHHVVTDPKNQFALVCDLGLDKVIAYKFDPLKGTITTAGGLSLKPGAGPRHLAFGRDGKFVYVINELDSTVTVFRYDDKTGSGQEVQSLSTLEKNYTGKNSPAEIAVHPNGKFVYGSNRGYDSIVVFAVDSKNGTLTQIQQQPTGGKIPRHFELSPDGKFLVTENQDSNTMFVFAVDTKTGHLKPTGNAAEVEGPQCLKFLPIK